GWARGLNPLRRPAGPIRTSAVSCFRRPGPRLWAYTPPRRRPARPAIGHLGAPARACIREGSRAYTGGPVLAAGANTARGERRRGWVPGLGGGGFSQDGGAPGPALFRPCSRRLT